MRKITIAFVGVFLCIAMQAKTFDLVSPGGNMKVSVNVTDRITYSVYADGVEIMKDNSAALSVDGQELGARPVLKSHRYDNCDVVFSPAVAYKFSSIRNSFNSLRLDFKGGWSLLFRAYDDGVAYRFVTDFRKTVDVRDEMVRINFPEGTSAVVQRSDSFETPYEEPYSQILLDAWQVERKKVLLPFLADLGNGYKMLVSESALTDYPCLFFESAGNWVLKGTFPKVPLEGRQLGDRYIYTTKEADYIARTDGSRQFPWRYFVIVNEDGRLIESTMTARLADKPVEDMSWIRPGQVSWEWWNAAAPYGPDVDFVSGFNTDTYKYYIDFASKYGIPYIIMDEGWAKSTEDPFTPSSSVDLPELLSYGEERGVGIILWMTWLAVDRNPDVFERWSAQGVKGFKIDFMNRSDQYMVNFYERVAEAAAKHRMVVSFHGAFKPSGLEYKYPNVLTYEGVRGMENMGGCLPSNSIWLPFIRNAAGPMDYTPGAMISMQPESYCGNRPNAASIGTRAYQLALYVLFESGLQMLSDSPTMYYSNPECTEFISDVPVVWDETRALQCKAGRYAVVAKRSGDRWYIGAVNGTDDNMEVEVSLDFLEKGKTYDMVYFKDGPNAFRQAMDYRRGMDKVTSGSAVKINMARNGGWTAVMEPQQ
ncbi:MAG: glycoside hydrolase family 97 protein [Bacteroidales bacterium]|nr:glycoside hydrolase family 97 protein [Bacteroidales bacterium]